MKFSLEFLGSGTSVGVPCIGCDCAVCQSVDPLNKRLRSSVLVRAYDPDGKINTTVVVDTAPDFREQMLRSKVSHIDAVIITHYHADHVVGIDDVRRFNYLQKQIIDCWATPDTLAAIRRSFGYVLVEEEKLRFGLPCLRAREMTWGVPFAIGSLRFQPIEMDHVVIKSSGLIISTENSEKLAYCLDVKAMPDASYGLLSGTHTLILDMLREKEHPTHLNFSEAMAVIEKVQPQRTFFGHIAHEVDHRPFESRLPPQVRLGYDGLIV